MADGSALNRRMHPALQEAAALMAQGRLTDAADRCLQLLDDPANRPDALHVLGVIKSEQGEADAGIALLQEAAELQPGNANLRFNHANVLLKAGRYAQAEAVFEALVAGRDPDAGILNGLGTCQFEQGKLDASVATYRQAVAANPQHPGAWQNLSQALLAQENAEGAAEAALTSLRIRPGHWETSFTLARARASMGDTRVAHREMSQLAEASPERADVWDALATAALADERPIDALGAIRKAIEIGGATAARYVTRGSVNVALNLGEEAERDFREAAALDPDLAAAPINLAQYLELANRVDEALAVAQSTEQRWPESAQVKLLVARCLRRQGASELALEKLSEIGGDGVPLPVQRQKEFELGALFDTRKDSPAAWRHFVAGNAIAAQEYRWRDKEARAYQLGISKALDVASQQRAWHHQDPEPANQPIFIVGFQRSGTTLLNTLLGAQRGFEIMEEPRTVSSVVATLDGYPECVDALTAEQVAAARNRYWDVVRELGFSGKARTVDKSPLAMIHAPLLRRLFPSARIVFALRHPLDVCLSCFMQDFGLNAITANYTRLEEIAAIYADVMTLWQKHVQRIRPNVHTVRYESLVREPENTLADLAEFLEIEWRGGVDGHQQFASERGLIDTPSYHQVGRKIYADAAWRWRRYEDQIAPIRARLAPFAQAYDYPT